MLSNGFARPLPLRRKPSVLLAVYLVVLHLLALVALCAGVSLSPLLLALAFLLVLSSIVFASRRYRLYSDAGDDYWTGYADGSWRYATLPVNYRLDRTASIETPWFVVLGLVASGSHARKRLLVLRDQLDAQSFRRLRVRIRLDQEDASTSRPAPL